MIHTPTLDASLEDKVLDLRSRDVPFAFATIVRTAGSTAAKPGTKALISEDGDVLAGWLGGGCTRSAVRKAAQAALADGAPKLISVAPEEALNQSGVAPGAEVDGVTFARNGCPSKGTIDIFIEPCLPMPELVVYGTSPVAQALRAQAGRFHWTVTLAKADTDVPPTNAGRYVVVATQGQGDRAALKAALDAGARYVAFVGSRRKFTSLAEQLTAEGIAADALDQVRAPAGLDIGAVTPDEIALSILAQLTQERRNRGEPARG